MTAPSQQRIKQAASIIVGLNKLEAMEKTALEPISMTAAGIGLAKMLGWGLASYGVERGINKLMNRRHKFNPTAATQLGPMMPPRHSQVPRMGPMMPPRHSQVPRMGPMMPIKAGSAGRLLATATTPFLKRLPGILRQGFKQHVVEPSKWILPFSVAGKVLERMVPAEGMPVPPVKSASIGRLLASAGGAAGRLALRGLKGTAKGALNIAPYFVLPGIYDKGLDTIMNAPSKLPTAATKVRDANYYK